MTHSHPYHRSTYLVFDGATSRRPLWIVNAVLALSLTIPSHGYAQDGHAHRQETKPVMSTPMRCHFNLASQLSLPSRKSWTFYMPIRNIFREG